MLENDTSAVHSNYFCRRFGCWCLFCHDDKLQLVGNCMLGSCVLCRGGCFATRIGFAFGDCCDKGKFGEKEGKGMIFIQKSSKTLLLSKAYNS